MFGSYLEVTDLLPVNSKSTFDFSRTDLVLTTVKKKISDNTATRTIYLDSFVNFSSSSFQNDIKMLAMRSLCPQPSAPTESLFQNAYWHGNKDLAERFPIIEEMMSDFIRDDIASEKHLLEILSRESVSSFAIENNIVFLYSVVPAQETKLSFMTLSHRIVWNTKKIQMVIMAVFCREDRNLLFYLNNLFYHSHDFEAFKIPQNESEKNDFFRLSGV